MVGTKVSIVSNKPQTTRTRVTGVINRPGSQIAVVDTPGLHKPRSPLGERLNETATEAASEVDVVLLVLDATAEVGRGDRFIAELLDALEARLPEGPRLFPEDMVTDVPEAFWVAELVREQLLARLRDELPHSLATRVTEWEWPRVRCEILVERDSQKGIVIGRGGSVLKDVGSAVRHELPEGAYLELFVKVDRDWQHRPGALQRLGY